VSKGKQLVSINVVEHFLGFGSMVKKLCKPKTRSMVMGGLPFYWASVTLESRGSTL